MRASQDQTAAGRWIEVPGERIVRWASSFADRHGGALTHLTPESVTLAGADGATARCHPPFPPVPGLVVPGPPAGEQAVAWAAMRMAEHAAAPRTVGVLLVRLGGFAAGVFQGSPPQLVVSKTGSRLVHGRSAAGGWSQHRFARRRDNQAAAALRAAADTAVAVLGPFASDLHALVLGGDRRAVAGLRDDTRLAPLLDRAVDRFLTVPDPRLAVLRDAPRLYGSIRIWLTGPSG